MLKLFFPAPAKWLLSDLSKFCFSPSFCFVFQPQQVVQKKPAQVRKNALNSLLYLKLNTSSVFKPVKSEGKCINNMKYRIATGLFGTTTQTIHVVALRKERRQQWNCLKWKVLAQKCPQKCHLCNLHLVKTTQPHKCLVPVQLELGTLGNHEAGLLAGRGDTGVKPFSPLV